MEIDVPVILPMSLGQYGDTCSHPLILTRSEWFWVSGHPQSGKMLNFLCTKIIFCRLPLWEHKSLKVVGKGPP